MNKPALWISVLLTAVLTACGGGAGGGGGQQSEGTAANPWPDTVAVRDPQKLTTTLDALRVPIGVPGDYKPDLALLSNGEIALVMFQPQKNSNGTYQENVILYRSGDGGVAWGNREVLPLLGREPYFTVLKDGTLFITAQLISTDYRNTLGYDYAIVHRSTDNGHTWTTMPILATDVPGSVPSEGTITSRTIMQLPDGSLVLGVSSGAVSYVWRSYDEGVTWNTSQTSQTNGYVPYGDGAHTLYGEMIFFETQAGSLLGIGRVSATAFPPVAGTQYPPQEDPTDRMALFRSTDEGATWTLEGAVGDYYGQMYPALLRLGAGQLLFTFTDRGLEVPLGIEAVLGSEQSDGFTLNFTTDRILLDTQTPTDQPSGGGFGNTLQLADGTLITAYSYRDDAGVTHAEVEKWELPAPTR